MSSWPDFAQVARLGRMKVPAGAAVCPSCHHSSPPGAPRCASCGAPFAPGADDVTIIHTPSPGASSGPDPINLTMTHAPSSGWSQPTRAGSGDGSGSPLEVGTVLADRYEILKMLGQG